MSQFEIGDIAVFDRIWDGNELTLLKESDHILRRFGQSKLAVFEAGSETGELVNEIEDEIWTLVTGKGTITFRDEREGSPSKNAVVKIELSEEKPVSVLVPFGLIYSFSAIKDSEIIFFRTHED